MLWQMKSSLETVYENGATGESSMARARSCPGAHPHTEEAWRQRHTLGARVTSQELLLPATREEVLVAIKFPRVEAGGCCCSVI